MLMEDMDSADCDGDEPVPHSASKAARRALILATVVCRGSIDHGAGDLDAESLYVRIPDWLTRQMLWDVVEPNEEAMLRAPLGMLEAKDVLWATWYVEGLAVLAWALKYFEFPKHEEQVEPYVVANALWFLDEHAGHVITDAELRKPAELEACRELLYAIHCRLRYYVRSRTPVDFTHWIEKEWLDILGVNADELIVHNDLAIDGKAISEVKEERLQELMSIIQERSRAIIWLVDGYAGYSQTPVDA